MSCHIAIWIALWTMSHGPLLMVTISYGHSSKMNLVQRCGFVWFVRVRLDDNLFDRRFIFRRFALTKLSIHFVNYFSSSIPNFQGLFRIGVDATKFI